MKKICEFFILTFTMLSIVVTIYSNTNLGRNIYMKTFDKEMSQSVNKLFSNPNKYRDLDTKQEYGGTFNWFSLEKKMLVLMK